MTRVTGHAPAPAVVPGPVRDNARPGYRTGRRSRPSAGDEGPRYVAHRNEACSARSAFSVSPGRVIGRMLGVCRRARTIRRLRVARLTSTRLVRRTSRPSPGKRSPASWPSWLTCANAWLMIGTGRPTHETGWPTRETAPPTRATRPLVLGDEMADTMRRLRRQQQEAVARARIATARARDLRDAGPGGAHLPVMKRHR